MAYYNHLKLFIADLTQSCSDQQFGVRSYLKQFVLEISTRLLCLFCLVSIVYSQNNVFFTWMYDIFVDWIDMYELLYEVQYVAVLWDTEYVKHRYFIKLK